MLQNPFVIYILTFASAIGLYNLGWSDVYPTLSADFYIFFAATFFVAALAAKSVSPLVTNLSKYQPGMLHWSAGLFVVVTFMGEIALAGGIPLILVMGGAKFYDMEAVAVHLHAFMFWSIYSTIRFADYLHTRRKLYLLEASLPVIFYFLLVYRGPAIICLMTWFFTYVVWKRGVSLIATVSIILTVVATLFVNGLIGDVRSPGQEHVAVPSKAFADSGMPGSVFWAYLYGTAPLGNLQLSVTRIEKTAGTISEFLASEFLPDTVSKKILPMLNSEIKSGDGNLQTRDHLYSWHQLQIAEGINTSTIFGRSYGFFGWVGPMIMFIALCLFILVYLLLIEHSPYGVAALAWLNTTVMFCLLNNMMVSAVTLLPLFMLVILPSWNSKKKLKQRASTNAI